MPQLLLDCGAEFTARSTLYVHAKRHNVDSANVTYPCEHPGCNKQYSGKSNLRKHMLRCHGNRIKTVARKGPEQTVTDVQAPAQTDYIALLLSDDDQTVDRSIVTFLAVPAESLQVNTRNSVAQRFTNNNLFFRYCNSRWSRMVLPDPTTPSQMFACCCTRPTVAVAKKRRQVPQAVLRSSADGRAELTQVQRSAESFHNRLSTCETWNSASRTMAIHACHPFSGSLATCVVAEDHVYESFTN